MDNRYNPWLMIIIIIILLYYYYLWKQHSETKKTSGKNGSKDSHLESLMSNDFLSTIYN